MSPAIKKAVDMPAQRLLPGINDPKLLSAYAQARRLLRRRYVTGVAVGQAWRGGQRSETAICVFVDQKLDESKLTKAAKLPPMIAGVPIDVIECLHTARFMTDAERRIRRVQRSDPVLPGVAIAAETGGEGTLGMIVTDSLSGSIDRCLLTAAHVLKGPLGTPVYQPAQETSSNLVGHIRRRVWNRRCDAAIASIAKRSVTNKPLGGALDLQGVRAVQLHEVLVKSGCMTGLTRAEVVHIGEFEVDYGPEGRILMQGFQLAPLNGDTDEISDRGDSGAIWYDEKTGQAVGITVAGDSLGAADPAEWVFACHLEAVFSELDIAMP